MPGNDPTLLFTNAGMVQFKDVFLGKDKRDYTRAATSAQRCVRAGGKHNDLENVGYTARHHTFFEMLGNFCFGDYFKKDAIRFAWEFVTDRTLTIDPRAPMVTVYRGRRRSRTTSGTRDRRRSEAPHRRSSARSRQLLADGRHRPVRPVHRDLLRPRPERRRRSAGLARGRRRSLGRDLEPRVHAVRPLADGTLTPLPKPSVDTGMGLERIAAVMQGVHSNYDIDLFVDLIARGGASATRHAAI